MVFVLSIYKYSAFRMSFIDKLHVCMCKNSYQAWLLILSTATIISGIKALKRCA